MRISEWSSDVCSSDLVYVSAAIAPATGDINKEIFRRMIVETDCPTGFFSLALYNADTVCQPECGLIFACRPGEISILGRGGISQRAATEGTKDRQSKRQKYSLSCVTSSASTARKINRIL